MELVAKRLSQSQYSYFKIEVEENNLQFTRTKVPILELHFPE